MKNLSFLVTFTLSAFAVEAQEKPEIGFGSVINTASTITLEKGEPKVFSINKVTNENEENKQENSQPKVLERVKPKE